MTWDDLLLLILAFFGAFSLLLAQVGEVLSRLPAIIRAWRQVREEWSGGADSGSPDRPVGAEGSDVPPPPD